MNDIIVMEGLIKRLRDKISKNKATPTNNQTKSRYINNNSKSNNIKNISLDEFRSKYKPIFIKIYNDVKREYNNLIKKYPEAKYIFKLNGYKEDQRVIDSYDEIEYAIIEFDLDNILKYRGNINPRLWMASEQFIQIWDRMEEIIENAIKKYGIDNMKYEFGGDNDGGPLSIIIPNIRSDEISEKFDPYM